MLDKQGNFWYLKTFTLGEVAGFKDILAKQATQNSNLDV